MKKQSKAQSSIEFVILITFMLIVFATIAYFIQTRTAEAQETANMNYAEQMRDLILNEISIAETMPFNYTKEFYLPLYIDGNNYTIAIDDGAELVINFRSKEYVYFLNKDFNWASTIQPGTNSIVKKQVSENIVYGFNVDIQSPYPNSYFNGTHSWVLGSILDQDCNEVCDAVDEYKCYLDNNWQDIDCDLIENYFGIECDDCSDNPNAINPRYTISGETIICYAANHNVNCGLSQPDTIRLCVCVPS